MPPPIISRLADASEATLRSQWENTESQLERALTYVNAITAAKQVQITDDPAFGWLRRTLREMDQYARAVRWVLTVTER